MCPLLQTIVGLAGKQTRENLKSAVRALTHFWVEWAGMPQLLESGKAPGKSTMLTYGITLYGKLSLSIQPSTQYYCLGKWGFISTKTHSLPHTHKTFNMQYSNTLILTQQPGANRPDWWFVQTMLLTKLLYAGNLPKRYLSVSIYF